jgi:hypothetical protein
MSRTDDSDSDAKEVGVKNPAEETFAARIAGRFAHPKGLVTSLF